MPEPEAVVARQLGPVGTDQIFAGQHRQPRRDLGLLGRERLNGAAVEQLSLDGAALEHGPLGRRRAGRGGPPAARAASAGPRRRRVSPAIASISVRKRGLPPAAWAIRSRSSDGRLEISSSADSAGSGSRRRATGQSARSGERARAGPCRRAGSAPSRRAAPRPRRGRGTSARPTGCRRGRRRAAPAPRAACGTPRRSPRRRSRRLSRRSATGSRRLRSGRTGRASSCLTTSTTGQ